MRTHAPRDLQPLNRWPIDAVGEIELDDRTLIVAEVWNLAVIVHCRKA